MESRFGYDFGQVRVHTGSRADAAARAVEARAFALSDDIVFGDGQYDPHGAEGRRLLAHELTHVIQQQPAARAKATQLTTAPTVSRHAQPMSIQRQKATPAAKTTDDPAFWEWWKLVVGFEGSLEAWKAQPANKNDRGGETNWGVTKKLYMERASALGLAATEEGFKAMTPDQAMLFGRMIWRASGAHKIKNTGVALVLGDWYWGGIHLDRLSNLLKDLGRAATFNEGKPDQATIDFMNTLSPSELVELMSNAKAAQYRQIVKKDPSQQKFLKGWLDRNEKRRLQAQPFVPGAKFPFVPGMSLTERGKRALREARALVQKGEAASADDRRVVNFELWSVVNAIDRKLKAGSADAEEAAALKAVEGELMKEISNLTNIPH
jgi:lysozyme family protein